MEVSHYVDDNGTLHIFVGDYSVADIRGCKRMSKNGIRLLIDEVLNDLGY